MTATREVPANEAVKVITTFFASVTLFLLAGLVFALGAPEAACWLFLASGTLFVPIFLLVNRDLKKMDND